MAQVEAMVGSGMPHNLSVLSDEAVVFFGLDAERDPRDAAAGSGGASGANGAAPGVAGALQPSAAGAIGTLASPETETASDSSMCTVSKHRHPRPHGAWWLVALAGLFRASRRRTRYASLRADAATRDA